MSSSMSSRFLPALLLFLITIPNLMRPSTSAVDSFVYGGCSQLKYKPGTPYESNVNSMLSSVVNSAAFAVFNNFKISIPGSRAGEVIYGLFQCRGDVGTPNCRDCVAKAVSQLGVLCPNSAGGTLQLDGCFVKYDNTSFLGVEDKTLVMKKCGTSVGFDSDALTRRGAVMGYLAAGGQYFRVGESGDIQGVAQCVQDLSGSECQDCLNEAIGRLKSECGSAAFGDMFLGKCYARYTDRGGHSNGGSLPKADDHKSLGTDNGADDHGVSEPNTDLSDGAAPSQNRPDVNIPKEGTAEEPVQPTSATTVRGNTEDYPFKLGKIFVVQAFESTKALLIFRFQPQGVDSSPGLFSFMFTMVGATVLFGFSFMLMGLMLRKAHPAVATVASHAGSFSFVLGFFFMMAVFVPERFVWSFCASVGVVFMAYVYYLAKKTIA